MENDLNLSPGSPRRVSLQAAMMCLVSGLLLTALVMSGVGYRTVSERNDTQGELDDQVEDLRLFEDVRSGGFAEGAAIASYFGVPSEDFLVRFAEARRRVEQALSVLQGSGKNEERLAELEESHAALSDLRSDTCRASLRGQRRRHRCRTRARSRKQGERVLAHS